MGIKNLLKFLSNYKDIIKETNINNYYGKRIAVDISILIYQIVISIRNTGHDIVNTDGEIVSHIIGLFNKTISLLDKGIIPIYVFDGCPPKIKENTINIRKQIRQNAINKLSIVESETDKIKYFKRCVLITKKQINECKELLEFMGIPYINAKEEADSQLSYLCKSNLVHAVLTEDMDILTFGSPKIIKNLLSFKKIPFELDLNLILIKLELNYDQFIELCILFGCDYCPILEINNNTIYNIYKKHKNIEDTLNELNLIGYKIPKNYNYLIAKKYFVESIHNEINIDYLKIKSPNYEKLLDLLVNKVNLNKYKIIYKLNNLYQLFNKLKDI
jgi:flap endonuclease-1